VANARLRLLEAGPLADDFWNSGTDVPENGIFSE
jgi:hypothetical protein